MLGGLAGCGLLGSSMLGGGRPANGWNASAGNNSFGEAVRHAASSGQPLRIAAGTLLDVAEPVRIERARVVVEAAGGVVRAARGLIGPWVTFVDCDVRFAGPLAFQGWETEAEFWRWALASLAQHDGRDPPYSASIWPALLFQGGNVEIDGLIGTRSRDGAAARNLVTLEDCASPVVRNVRFTGFFSADDGDGPPLGRYCPAIRIDGGRAPLIEECHARQCGQLLLAQRGSTGGRAVGGSSTFTKDNGIYISSGEGWTVTGGEHRRTRGYGVKTRGSFNTVENVLVEDTSSGIGQTGRGVALDRHGANGRGNRCIGNTVRRYSGYGYSFAQVTGLGGPAGGAFQRDHLFSRCVAEASGPAQRHAAVRAIYVGGGSRIEDVTVNGFRGTAPLMRSWAAIIGGPGAGAPAPRIEAQMNFRDVSGVTRPLRLQNAGPARLQIRAEGGRELVDVVNSAAPQLL
ncbi:MAG: hypothetical protein ACK4K7_02970 [Allosphingosinicella sp.]